MGKHAGVSMKIRRLVCALVALLSVSLSVASVEARGGGFVISPSGEAIEKIQLAPPDNVVGNMSVSNGFVDFFVTNPSDDIVYQSLNTSFDSFNFAANESGIYVMHFVNRYQSGDVNVTLCYGLNFFFAASVNIGISTFSTETTTLGDATITRVQPYLHLDVSPLAFPVVGQFWKLLVYYQTNSSDGIAYYSPLPNATVEVTIRVGNQTKVYSITSDEVGHAEFQFLAEYSDISFQAVSGGNKSDIFALTQRAEHYVSADFVDFMFELSAVMSGISAVSVAILHFGKRIRVIFSLLIVVVFCLSMLQLVISVYSKLFLWTPWGYSESIFSFFTWATLKYASLSGIVLFAVLCLLALWLKLRSPKLVVPLK